MPAKFMRFGGASAAYREQSRLGSFGWQSGGGRGGGIFLFVQLHSHKTQASRTRTRRREEVGGRGGGTEDLFGLVF